MVGKYKHQTGALIGWEAITTLQKYQIDCAFLGVNGIKSGFIYDTDPDEAMIKAEVIKRATKSYILADSSKFSIKSLVKFASRSEVEIITSL